MSSVLTVLAGCIENPKKFLRMAEDTDGSGRVSVFADRDHRPDAPQRVLSGGSAEVPNLGCCSKFLKRHLCTGPRLASRTEVKGEQRNGE